MAKVVGPLHSSEARGSVGDLTYGTWRGISVVKTRKGPTKQYEDDQVAVRNKATVATAAWQAMTDAQHKLWNDYADGHPDVDWTGNDKRLTGYNWYVRINVRRQLIGLGTTTTLPVDPVTYQFDGLNMTGAAIDLTFWWTSTYWAPLGQQYIEFYIAGPHSNGRYPNLPEADRKGHIAEIAEGWSWAHGGVGWYTAFVRPLSMEGLVGGFLRLRAEVT